MGAALPLNAGVEVLRDDFGLLALYKPGGLRSHPNRDGKDGKALLDAEWKQEEEAYERGGETWHLLHRLDAPTSGVILLARDATVATAVKEEFARHLAEVRDRREIGARSARDRRDIGVRSARYRREIGARSA